MIKLNWEQFPNLHCISSCTKEIQASRAFKHTRASIFTVDFPLLSPTGEEAKKESAWFFRLSLKVKQDLKAACELNKM